MAQAIWKDYKVDLSAHLTDGAADYEIRKGAQVLFSGRAVAAPDGTCRVRVNDVCASLLWSALPDLTVQGFTADGSAADFSLYVGATKVEDFTLFRDWSYDRGFDPWAGGVSSDPVRGEVDIRMPLLFSRVKAGSVALNVRGSASTVSATGPGVVVVPAQGAAGTVTIGGITYRLLETCRRYALYYVNAYGGWDQLLMRSGEETSAFSRDTYRSDYDNAEQTAVGEHNWRTGVTRSWALRTGVLTDEEARKVVLHVAGATQAFLFDMQEGTVLPVIMTNPEETVRTFSLGKRRVEYTLACRLAQTELRR